MTLASLTNWARNRRTAAREVKLTAGASASGRDFHVEITLARPRETDPDGPDEHCRLTLTIEAAERLASDLRDRIAWLRERAAERSEVARGGTP